jgi:photosystem II stability/assembly factor-like uncharacterized protein
MAWFSRSSRWALFFALAVGPTVAWALDPAVPAAMQADAQLADVCFVDAANGWAVGDRGAIWQTSDGGAHWQPQASGIDCRLASVCFLDAKIGWAAGGFTQPYTRATRGVVLRTRDGGTHWTVDRKLVLPAIRRVRFFDPAHGWALGQSSAYFPSGVYATVDGGRSWSAMPAAQTQNWLAGDLIDPDTGALAGRASALAVVRRRSIEPLVADYGLRALGQMKLVAPSQGWLVGDGGLVLKTQDLGKSWQTAESEIPAALRNQFDFRALAVHGQHCWVAGTPGTCVLHSADAGRTWSVGHSGQSLPLASLAFVDEQTGWAVGDLGTILGTTDGGKTWRKQRSGGNRSAYLGFYSRALDIPLELVARLSADDGYLGAIEVLNREDIEAGSAADGDLAAAAHEASVLAGASATQQAWRFPLRSSGLKLSAEQLVEGWNQANDGGALEKLESHVVARIRMWRPNVVFTAAAESLGRDPLSHLVNQLVLRAVERAADPARYPEQISAAGLQPWQVQKVYGTLPPGQTGNVNVNTAQLAARLGRSVGELAAPARGVIAAEFAPPSANVGFRLLVDHIPQGVGQRDFFSGIALSPGGDARRAFEEAGDNNLEAMRREAQLRRNLQAILAQADSGDGSDGRFLAGIGQQTRTLAPARAAEVLFQLAERYDREGRWELAAECFAMIVDRYPGYPLAASSLVWLVQYYASSEAAWRNRSAQQMSVQQVSAQAPPLKSDRVERAGGVSAAARIERSGGLVTDVAQSDGRLAKAAGYAKQLEQLEPALFGEPTVRFPLAAAHRQQGLPRQAERFYLALRHARPHDAWWGCAQSELWLAERKGQPPKALWNCARAQGKPRLDGRLDEPMWRAGNSVELRSPQRDDADWGAVAMLAYDEEFLYVGVSCTSAAGFKYTSSDRPRPRDADLSGEDRVELLLDTDRDFATYYRLVIDHRGFTGESCWHDKNWNPNWFVARGGGEGAWTAEAAIPLSELTGQPPTSRQAWAVGMQRVVPGVGFQSWNTPASTEIRPEGFGFVIFQ